MDRSFISDLENGRKEISIRNLGTARQYIWHEHLETHVTAVRIDLDVP